ncbi:gamma-glutamylcyclotransferase [Zoogloeaceae bacterium G21618-S1]|nr:gamma-glutamylcyclotransferase [Zoogloeaceae bacterium G21618-S1]
MCLTATVVFAFAVLYYTAGPLDQLSWRKLPGGYDKPFLPCVERAFLEFVTLSGGSTQCVVPVPWLDKAIAAVQILCGLFFFAAIVAFVTAVVLRPKAVFALKHCLNLHRAEGRYDLIFSVYNASPVTLSQLHVRIIARARIDQTTLRNVLLRDDAPRQPLAEPYIPLRIRAPLNDFGITINAVDAQGFVTALSVRTERDPQPLPIEEVYAEIRGVMLGIEQPVQGAWRYCLAEKALFHGRHQSVDSDYPYARGKGLFRRLSPPGDLVRAFHRNASPLVTQADKIYVFGFGSLVDPASFSRTIGRDAWLVEDFPLATLEGYKRVWGVAMDNRVSLPGYKHYVRADAPDSVPAVHVCFLDVAPDASQQVVGVLVAVSEDEFARLKQRERNYEAVDVTAAIVHPPLDGRVFAFMGLAEAKARFDAGRAAGTLVINTAYQTQVECAYRSRGKVAFDNYREATEIPDGVALVALKMVRIPETGGR